MKAEWLTELARLRGIGDAFHDYRGELRRFSLATKTELLRAMGVAVDDPTMLEAEVAAARRACAGSVIRPVVAIRPEAAKVAIVTRADQDWITLTFEIRLAPGGTAEGAALIRALGEIERFTVDDVLYVRRELPLPAGLPPGYHQLDLRVGDHAVVSAQLIVASPQCQQYAQSAAGCRGWGVAVQLYALRSAKDWGIGDFRDLDAVVQRLAPLGASFVGLNPLHAQFGANPAHCSPYSASSRLALNTLYIQPEWLPELAECVTAQAVFASAAFQLRLQAVRAAAHVDYSSVAALKREVLELLFGHFRSRHLELDTTRGQAFGAFVAARGEALHRHGLFEALDEYLQQRYGSVSGWQNWPAEYRRVDGPAAQAFAVEYAERVQFHVWLQWVAAEQLASAQQRARELGMSVGLYADLAVGVNAGGAEVWSDPDSFALGASIGAPPDRLALKGQDWGLPPYDPQRLEARGFEPYKRLLRATLQSCGAIRFDHVMALFRQWWVPRGVESIDGAYVHFPLDVLLSILALESVAQQVIVVGEDLGVVPDEVGRAMHDYGVYHYKVLLFEKEGERFRAPDQYARRAIATATTHDLPTLRAWWQGDDIALRERLALYPADEVAWQIAEDRRRDREQLLVALESVQLQPVKPRHGDDPYSDELARAVHEFLAASNAELVAVQIEDLLGMTEPVNVPGTSGEYPNWRRKLPLPLEKIFERADILRALQAVNRRRAT
ncbi:MAG TPA: 4-alpha-glucanotransferase [Steroidobacteraceae bacterium]|nr:4-alpha-glucanotransferase [Steroidobacteraceae bacterium]